MPVTTLAGAPFRTKSVVLIVLHGCRVYQKNKPLIDAFFAGDTLILAMLAALDAACSELITLSKTDVG